MEVRDEAGEVGKADHGQFYLVLHEMISHLRVFKHWLIKFHVLERLFCQWYRVDWRGTEQKTFEITY